MCLIKFYYFIGGLDQLMKNLQAKNNNVITLSPIRMSTFNKNRKQWKSM